MNIIAPDDIKPGQWLMVTGMKHPTPDCSATVFDGAPMKVVAVSYPFIATRILPGTIHPDIKLVDTLRFNVGTYNFAKVTPAYRRAFARQAKKEEKPSDTYVCPTCGGKPRMQKPIGCNEWQWVCEKCHTVITPPSTTAPAV